LPLADVRTNSNLAIDLLNCPKGDRYHQSPLAQIHGYAGVRPQRHLIYDLKHPGALSAAGVTDGLSQNDYKDRGRSEEICLNSVNRAQLIAEARVSSDPAKDVEEIDPLQQALVEANQHLPTPNPKDRLVLRIAEDRPGHLAFDLENNRDALLVTTESFHPGWRVSVDGADVPVLRVNGDFLGVRVGAAAQRVECYFSDNWHAVGRWVSLGSLGLLGLVLCLKRMRQNTPGFVR